MLYYIWNKMPWFIDPYLSVIFYIHKFIFIILCNLEISIRTQKVLICENVLYENHELVMNISYVCLLIDMTFSYCFLFGKEQIELQYVYVVIAIIHE